MITEKPRASLPVQDFRISAPAAEKTLWPEKNSGKGGVTTDESW